MKLPFVPPFRLARRRMAKPARCLAIAINAPCMESLRFRIRHELEWSRLQNLVNRGYSSLDRLRGAPSIWRQP